MAINELAAEIDETRDPMDAGLASAIRDYVLAHFMTLNRLSIVCVYNFLHRRVQRCRRAVDFTNASGLFF